MSSRNAWIAAAAVGLIAIALWHDAPSSPDDATVGTSDQHTRAAMRQLRGQVASLHAELAALRVQPPARTDDGVTQASAPPGEGETLPDDSAEPDRAGPPGSAAHAAQIASELDHHLDVQDADPAWAVEVQTQVADALSRPALRGAALRDLACGASLCRLEASWDDAGARDDATSAIPSQPPFNTHGFIHVPEDAHTDAIVYFARRGDALPWPSGKLP